MHTFGRPKPSPLSKEHTFAVSMVEGSPDSRGASSPPLTSSLHSRGSAASAEESAYLRRASLLKWARLIVAGFTIAIGAAIVGVSSDLLKHYNETVMPGQWNLSLWPVDADVRPALSALVSAAIAVFGGVCYIAFALVPSPRSRFLTQNYMYTAVSTGGAIATIVALVLNFYIENQISHNEKDSIHSWTCGLYNGASLFASESSDLQISVMADQFVPSIFRQMCIETLVAKWMLVVMLAAQLLSIVVSTLGLTADMRIGRYRRARFIEKSSFT